MRPIVAPLFPISDGVRELLLHGVGPLSHTAACMMSIGRRSPSLRRTFGTLGREFNPRRRRREFVPLDADAFAAFSRALASKNLPKAFSILELMKRRQVPVDSKFFTRLKNARLHGELDRERRGLVVQMLLQAHRDITLREVKHSSLLRGRKLEYACILRNHLHDINSRNRGDQNIDRIKFVELFKIFGDTASAAQVVADMVREGGNPTEGDVTMALQYFSSINAPLEMAMIATFAKGRGTESTIKSCGPGQQINGTHVSFRGTDIQIEITDDEETDRAFKYVQNFLEMNKIRATRNQTKDTIDCDSKKPTDGEICNVLLAMYIEHGDGEMARRFFRKMESMRIDPDPHSYELMVGLFLEENALGDAQNAINLMRDRDMAPNRNLLERLRMAYLERGRPKAAKAVTDLLDHEQPAFVVEPITHEPVDDNDRLEEDFRPPKVGTV